MKLMFKSHSVRFRIKDGELNTLFEDGRIASETIVPGPDGELKTMRFEVRRAEKGSPSGMLLEPFAAILALDYDDVMRLRSDEAGVYLRPDYQDHEGVDRRTVIYIEVDRKRAGEDKKKKR